MPLDQSPPLNSLGFAKAPTDTRVVVAMSGGVASSVVAAMLAEEGYDVVGVTLQLYDHGAALAKKGACCAGIDIHDARRVAEDMGFLHYVLDYENVFKDAVIDEFAGNQYHRCQHPHNNSATARHTEQANCAHMTTWTQTKKECHYARNTKPWSTITTGTL